MKGAILTRANGTPFCRPEPADYSSAVEYMRAVHAFHDAVADAGNAAFDAAFRRALVEVPE